MRVLLVGDVVGRPGRRAVARVVPQVVRELEVDLVVANGENAAGGFGLTPQTAQELFAAGVHVLTTGNHVWDRKELLAFIDGEARLLRPANFPPGSPGRGFTVVQDRAGRPVAVLNLMGRTFMEPLDCPFRTADVLVEQLRSRTPVILVDFHAEATAEKVAMGWYLDGRVSAVFGTHTHVPTADERVLPGGTAYITDLGMVGPADGIIGMDRRAVIDHILTRLPRRYEVASGPVRVDMAVVEIDPDSGRATAIRRLHRHLDGEPGGSQGASSGEPTKPPRPRED